MIVTCEKCSTRFELDEDRIPSAGAQLRCSRCKHSFFLPHPSASETDSVHAIAEEAAADATAGVPDATSDLGSAPDEEDDWQFSEEIRTAGDDELDGSDGFEEPGGGIFDEGFDVSALGGDSSSGDLEIDGSFTGPGGDAGSQLDPNALNESGLEIGEVEGPTETVEPSTTPTPPPTVDAPDAGVEAGHDESSFGSVDDFTSWMEDEDDPSPAADESVPQADAAESPVDHAEDPEDPESWDLAPDSDLGSRPTKALPRAVGSISAGAALAERIGSQGAEAASPTPYADELSEPSTLNRVISRLGALAGWAVAIPIVAYVAYLAFESDWKRWAPAPQSYVAGTLAAETTRTAWVETSRSGSLLVVDGVVRNTGASVLWLEGLEIILLGEQGERIPGSSQSLGTPLPEETMREAPLPALQQALAMAHKGFLANPLAPGEVRPFQTIVTELPEGARRLLLEKTEKR